MDHLLCSDPKVLFSLAAVPDSDVIAEVRKPNVKGDSTSLLRRPRGNFTGISGAAIG